jgi:hypothetical protein
MNPPVRSAAKYDGQAAFLSCFPRSWVRVVREKRSTA